MKVLDTTALSALLIPGVSLYRKGSSVPIKHAKERLELLIEKVTGNHEQIIIPTPVLSELLVKIPPDKVSALLDQLNSSIWFRIESFDAAVAVELGMRIAKARIAGDKREGLPAETPWAKVKFDRQIVAIAIAVGATEIISDDPDVKAIGDRWGMRVLSVEDLEIPQALVPPPLLEHLEDDVPAEAESSETGKPRIPSE